MVQYFLDGDIETSRELQLKMKPLIDALFIEVNPIPVREAMNILGMDVGSCRLPLVSMGEANRNKLIEEMAAYGMNVGGK